MTPDPYKYFRIEAREALDLLSRHAGELREDGAAASVARILRMAHTLKGAARVVRLSGIAQAAHALEELLEPHRDVAGAVAPAALEEVYRILDAIRAQVAALDPASETAARSSAADGEQVVRVELADIERLLEATQQVSVQLSAMRAALDGLQEARVMLARLSERQLVAGVASVLDRTASACAAGMQRARRDLDGARADLGRLRLVEASALAGHLEAAARDAARSLGKQVNVAVLGGATRLDAHVLAALRDALQHAVRNAVVHGLEHGQDRLAAGKPPAGNVTVRFERQGQRIRVSCDDDGRGVDVTAVHAAAVRKGVLAGSAALDTHSALELILEKSLSTSPTVTELAGRGVGVDTIRDVVRRLKGTVTFSSDPGRGMAVMMLVPVSLFSVPVVVARVSGRDVAVPQEAVASVETYGPESLMRSATGRSLLLGGTPVPFVSLASALRWEEPPAAAGRETALIVDVDGVRAAIGVDRAVETTELIVAPLTDAFPPVPLVSGVSFDADGRPELVLDPHALLEAARVERAPAAFAPVTRPAVLVVDDSLTTRMLEASILEAAGYDVALATSGEQGLEMAARRRYAVFIVDIEMPGVDGIEFIERARRDPGLRDVPAILVTSLGSREDRERGLAAGARGYIVKSEFEQERFLRLIAQLAGRGAASR